MPTLDDVISQIPGLRYAQRPGGAARAVVGVWPAGGDTPRHWDDGREISGWRGMLALVSGEPGGAPFGPLVAAVAAGGAAGIVSCGPPPAALLSAARLHKLPVVEASTADTGQVEYLAQAVADLRDAETKPVRQLLKAATARDADRQVLAWLAEAVSGEVLLVAPYQVALPMLSAGQIVPGEPIAALAESDQLGAKELDVDGTPVFLSALDTGTPRHVLVVARRGGWPPAVRSAMSQAGRVLASSLRQASLSEAGRVPVRTAVLQMLLDGQVLPARHAAGPLHTAHDVLYASQIRVCVISVRQTLRDAVTAALHHHLGAKGLVAPSTANPQHIVLIIVADDRILTRLRDYLAPRPWAYTGVSGPMPLDQAGTGHRHALQALAAATNRPSERWAQYAPLPDLASALPIDLAHRWQRARLEPLESLALSAGTRELWLETTRMVMTHGTTVTAQAMGVNPNTVRRRAAAVADVLGLDLADVGDRIVLDLALRIRRLRLRAPARSGHGTFGELLETHEAATWARNLLGQLPDPALLEVLVVWLDARLGGTEAVSRRAAERLGIAPKTLRRRLHEAETLLGRTLVTSTPAERAGRGTTGQPTLVPGSGSPSERGVHDLMLAAHITGALQRPILTSRHTQR